MMMLAACASGTVRTRAANEFGCPRGDVRVEGIGGGAWRASGCGQSAIYVCEGVCIRQSASGSPPSSGVAPAAVASGVADGVKMQIVENDDVRFEMPEWFKRDEDAKEAVYRDDNRHHAVRLTVADSDLDEAAWLDEHHSAAERWTETIAGTTRHFATRVGSKLRLTVAVIATGARVYELACTSDDLKKPKTDVTCAAILRSLRRRAPPKPAGSTI